MQKTIQEIIDKTLTSPSISRGIVFIRDSPVDRFPGPGEAHQEQQGGPGRLSPRPPGSPHPSRIVDTARSFSVIEITPDSRYDPFQLGELNLEALGFLSLRKQLHERFIHGDQIGRDCVVLLRCSRRAILVFRDPLLHGRECDEEGFERSV